MRWTTRNGDARRRIVIAALGLTMSVAGVRPAASQAAEDQVRDSAGVTISEYAGSDVELSWALKPLWTLGGTDDGPAAFFRVDRGALGTDSRGRLYVLDQGNREVRVFTSGGAHVRTFGSEGAGPGELRFPFSLAVAPDGSAGVVDLGKGALVRFDSSGAPLSEVSLSPPYLLDPVYLDGRLVATLAHLPVPGDSTLREIVILKEDGYVSLAGNRSPPPVDVDLGCAHVGGLPRVFQPEMHSAALSSGRLVVSRSSEYRLELLDAAGRVVGLIRRVIAPQPASAGLAARELGGDGQTFPGDGGQTCEVDVKKVVEARGFADVVPAVRGIVATPDGGWWVERGVGTSDRHYDVFSPAGVYVGTLSKGTPRPALFLDDDVFVSIQRDDLDRLLLRAYRVDR